jgi:uncharacterized membrane protein
MNNAHYHLVVNHLPIITPLLGAMILLGGIILKNNTVKKTALVVFIFGSIAAFLAMYTGEGAEEIVEKIQGVSEDLIKNHEELAEKFALANYLLGFVSLIGLWVGWKKESFFNLISILVLVISFGVLFLAKQTGTSGGEIMHPEIRTDFSPQVNASEGDED